MSRQLFQWEIESHQLRVGALARGALQDPEVLKEFPGLKKLLHVFGEDKIMHVIEGHDNEKLYDEVLDYLTRQKGTHIEAQRGELKAHLVKVRENFNLLEHKELEFAKIKKGVVPVEGLITQSEIDEAFETIETWADWKDRHLNPGNAKEFAKAMKSPTEYADWLEAYRKEHGNPLSESEIKIHKNIKKLDKFIDQRPLFYERATEGMRAEAYTASKIKALPVGARLGFLAFLRPVLSAVSVAGTALVLGEWAYSGRDLGEELTILSFGLINEMAKDELSDDEKLKNYNWLLNKSFDERLRWSCQLPADAKLKLNSACIQKISCGSRIGASSGAIAGRGANSSVIVEIESLEDLFEAKMELAREASKKGEAKRTIKKSHRRKDPLQTSQSRFFEVEFINPLNPLSADIQIRELKKGEGDDPKEMRTRKSEASRLQQSVPAWSLRNSLNKKPGDVRLPDDQDILFLVRIKSELQVCCKKSRTGKVVSCLDDLVEQDSKFHQKSMDIEKNKLSGKK